MNRPKVLPSHMRAIISMVVHGFVVMRYSTLKLDTRKHNYSRMMISYCHVLVSRTPSAHFCRFHISVKMVITLIPIQSKTMQVSLNFCRHKTEILRKVVIVCMEINLN